MTQPTFSQLRSLSQSGPGYSAETPGERMITLLAIAASGQNPDGTAFQAGSAGSGNLPGGGVPVSNATNSAAGAANVTLAASATQFTYLSSFSVTGLGATGASVIAVTITGVTGTPTYQVAIPASATTAITPLVVWFPTPIRSTAINTAITVNVPSFGAGNTAANTTAQGYYL